MTLPLLTVRKMTQVPQYRSVIFTKHKPKKKRQNLIKRPWTNLALVKPIVTGIEAFKNFYPAENYHQNYYNDNQNQGCADL